MNYEELREFLAEKMRLSHIYRPLLIRSLIDRDGAATVRQLATMFLAHDESQLLYYEKRLKEMPIRVLSRHDVVSREGMFVRLNVPTLTLQQKAELRRICEDRIQGYIKSRGLAIWDYRLLDQNPVPDSLRYRVLNESNGRCALCGATKMERPLDVDHIIPRSRGGKTEYDNLQVLCSKCNRSKGNKDTEDFRHQLDQESVEGWYASDQPHLFIRTDFRTIRGGGAQWLILMARQRAKRVDARSGRSICGRGPRAV